MALVDDILDGYKRQLEADIARWDYPETRFMSVSVSGDIAERNGWHVDLIFENFEEPEDQNLPQTVIVPVVSVVFQIPVEKSDRHRFHCSPDEDGLLAAIWRLTYGGGRALRIGAPTVVTDTDVWGAGDAASPRMWLTEVQLSVAAIIAQGALEHGN